MALEHHPITTSSVILLNSSQTAPNPPPSPPSPATPCSERSLSPPLDGLGDLLSSIASLQDLNPATEFEHRLSNAVHVLETEATSLACLTKLYETDPIARKGFNAAINALTRTTKHPGKVIVSGIGKSGYICQKLVATLRSLRISATYLHPTEALHGDLGLIDPVNDTIILITYSGSTDELMKLLPHLPPLPLIVMTRHTTASDCKIIKQRPDAILLPAPIHKSETDSYGFNAPTTSTTICIALCDALAVVLANHLHEDPHEVFLRYHPGGAIGAAVQGPKRITDLTIPFSEISDVESNAATGGHILMAAYRSKTRWLKQGDQLISPRRIERMRSEYLDEPYNLIPGLMVPQKDWLEVDSTMDISEAKNWVQSKYLGHDGAESGGDGILAVMDDDMIVGVMDIGDLMKA